MRVVKAKDLPEGTLAISGSAVERTVASDALYTTEKPRLRKRAFTAIPYALWQNRGPAEMQVWSLEA